MKRNVNLLSMLRQPLRTLLLLLLVGAISFAAISRAIEYIVVTNESERLSGYYKAIGSLIPEDPENYLMTDELAQVLSNSRYVGFEDYRRTCSAVMDGIQNIDTNGYTSDCSLSTQIMTTSMPSGTMTTYDGAVYTKQSDGVHVSDVYFYGVLQSVAVTQDVVMLTFISDGILAGHDEYAPITFKTLLFYPYVNVPPDMLRGADNTTNEDGSLLAPNEVFGGMVVGERYLVKGYYDRLYPIGGGNIRQRLIITPLTGDGLWYLPAPTNESINYDAPELADLKRDLEVLRTNQSSMQIISSKDMRSIPEFQEELQTYYLTDGRWLNHDDDMNENRVCVVNSQFARARDLKVGDTIKLTLRDMQSVSFGYITDSMGDTWKNQPTAEEELEIVGLWSNHNREDTHYSMDTLIVYIPDSVMPASFGGNAPARVAQRDMAPIVLEWLGESLFAEVDIPEDYDITYLKSSASEVMFAPTYSFALTSNSDKDAFMAESGERLAELGFSVTFAYNNAEAFASVTDPILWSVLVNAEVYSILLVLALALAVFLYLQQRRREFAIARALGVPAFTAVRQLLTPLALFGGAGIIAGGVLSWSYALDKAAVTLAPVLELGETGMAGGLSPVWLAGLTAFCLLLLLVFTLSGALFIARRPVLALLQGVTAAPVRKQSRKTSSAAADTAALTFDSSAALSRPYTTPERQPLFVPQCRYILRHIKRSPVKSLLVILVAAAFMVSLGWMNSTIEYSSGEIDRLYNTLEVGGEITRVDVNNYTGRGAPIVQTTVNKVFDTGLVTNAYLVATSPPLSSGATTERGEAIRDASLTFFTNEPAEWNKGLMLDCINIVAFDHNGLFNENVGTDIAIEYAEGYDDSMFTSQWDADNPVVMSRSEAEFLGKQLGDTVSFYLRDRKGQRFHTAIIAGVYDGEIEAIGSALLMPLSVYQRLENGTLRYITAQFIFDRTKNRELSETRDIMQTAVAGQSSGLAPVRMIIWDEELRLSINPLEKTLSLMTVLYPVTLAVSALISAGLAILLVLMSAKEAAIMRVLGTTRRKTRGTLLAEQVLLCIIGLLTGGGTAAMLFGKANYGGAALYLAAGLATALYGSHLVTKNKPLELLQVKE